MSKHDPNFFNIKKYLNVNYLDPHYHAGDVKMDLDTMSRLYFMYGALSVIIAISIYNYGIMRLIQNIVTLLKWIITMLPK